MDGETLTAGARGALQTALLGGGAVGSLEAAWLGPGARSAETAAVGAIAMGSYAVGAALLVLVWAGLSRALRGRLPLPDRAGAAALPWALAATLATSEALGGAGRPVAVPVTILAVGGLSWAAVTALLRPLPWAVRGLAPVATTVGLTVLAAASVLRGAPEPGLPGTAGRIDVLLVTVDTLRADRVGIYGYGRAHTPRIDALASRGALFTQAAAPAPLTGPSHASILTGLYPERHGAYYNGLPLADEVTTLAERLADAGYETAAVISGYPLTDPLSGLARGFAVYEERLGSWLPVPDRAFDLLPGRAAAWIARCAGIEARDDERPAAETAELALDWLSRPRDRPYFLWVHFFDPHWPYTPPGADGSLPFDWYREGNAALKERIASDPHAVARLSDLYDAEIATVDAQIGRLLDALPDGETGAGTLVVLTADHGEGLGDHRLYFEHSNHLYQEEMRVPLIVRPPGGLDATRVVPEVVSLVDLMPTVLDFAAVPAGDGLDGRSLRPLVDGRGPLPPRPVFGGVLPGLWESGRSLRAVVADGFKLIETTAEWSYYGLRRPPTAELYDLDADPGEHSDLAGRGLAVEERLQRALATRGLVDPQAVDPDVLDRLRALGYGK